MKEEQKPDEEEVDPFEWTTEMELHYNRLEVACSGLAAMDSFNAMTNADEKRKKEIERKCLLIIEQAIDFFSEE